MNEKQNGVTSRSIAVAFILTLFSALWIGQVEIINFYGQLSQTLPPVPAIAGIVIIMILNPVLSLISGKFKLTRAENLVIYTIIAVAVSMMSLGVIRQLLPFITAQNYFMSSDPNYERIANTVPSWVSPSNKEVVRQMYEGNPDGTVPWGDWIVPLIFWSAVFLIIFFTLFCVLVILRKQWIDKEKLVFPLTYLPMEITETDDSGSKEGKVPFFRDPVMWIGFVLAILFGLTNALNKFYPEVPAMGASYDLGYLFTDPPLSLIKPLSISWEPSIWGLAFLVPLEVSFSIWFFFILGKIVPVFTGAAGISVASGFPFMQEQAIGGFLAYFFVMLWFSKTQLKEVIKKAVFNDKSVDDSTEAIPYKVAFWGMCAGIAVLLCLLLMMKIHFVIAIFYLSMLLTVAVVYSRVRAETGIPNSFMFPYFMQSKIVGYTLGSKTLLGFGDATFVNLAVIGHLARGFFPETVAYQAEAFKLADNVNMHRRNVMTALAIAVILGLTIGYYQHLSLYYKYGSNVLDGGGQASMASTGSTRVRNAVLEFQTVSSEMALPKNPDNNRIKATVSGAGVVLLITVLRRFFLWFPLHPIGYLCANSYGMPIWFAFLGVWIIKSLVLKLGGVVLYKKLIPGFVGYAFGYFVWMGIIGTLVRST
ncbi:MAG: DUF6785 family protein [Elusimicrobiota bacterium]